MAEKTKSTQEELPLHEVVLKLMFEFNKEKPAELTPTDVFWKISDSSLSELQITQVLNWLVNEKRVEQFAGKYSLDRFEFLEQRSRDNAEANPNGVNSKASKEEIPLHETVLKIMFDANSEKPAEMTSNDVFWKISDPAVSERNIAEVLTWLVGQRKVDHFAGKYSLDRFEFLEQKNAKKVEVKSDVKPAKTKPVSPPKPKEIVPPKPPKAPKPPVEPAPKVVVEEPKKPSPPKAKPEAKAKEPEPVKDKIVPKVKVAPKVQPKPVREVIPAQAITKRWDKFNTTVAALAGVILIYMIFLISSAIGNSNSDNSANSNEVQTEIVRLEDQYNKLNTAQSQSEEGIELLENKMQLLEEINQKRSVLAAIHTDELLAGSNLNSLLLRLIVANLLLTILLIAAVGRRI